MASISHMYFFGTAEKNLCDLDVPKEDAEKIVKVTWLTTKSAKLQGEIEQAEEKIRTLKDAADEILTCFEDDSLLSVVGQGFLPIDEADATALVERATAEEEKVLGRLKGELESAQSDIMKLKAELRGKYSDELHLGTA